MTTVEVFEGIDARLVCQAHFIRTPDDRIREGELTQAGLALALAECWLEDLRLRA